MSHVQLNDVSVRFRKYTGRSTGLKEAVLRLLRPPSWYDRNRPSKTEFWGLKGVSLSLQEGDRLGIVGHNGAGKSTLLKVISRIYRPTVGQMSVGGRIAPLIEIGAGFNPELTGRENAYLNAAILGISRKVVAERMDNIVSFAELEEFIDMPVKYYSTGMHLRLAFTIATEVTPDILILDELYAGGDVQFVEKANTRLDKFIRESKILILVAHNLPYIERFCNRAIILDHGMIRFAGDAKDAVARYLAYNKGDKSAYEGGSCGTA